MARKSTKKLTTMAMLFALAIVLSFVESLIAPMFALPPGVKLGLGNIVVMYCMMFMGYGAAFEIAALKGLFSFLTRGFTAGVLSFTGGVFSITIMYLLRKLFKDKVNYHTLSVFGALFHNIGQLTAFSVMFTNSAPLAYLPVLTVSAVVMGIVTGSTLKVVLPALKRI